MNVTKPKRLFFIEPGFDVGVVVELADAGNFFRFLSLYSLGFGLLGFQFGDGHNAARIIFARLNLLA